MKNMLLIFLLTCVSFSLYAQKKKNKNYHYLDAVKTAAELRAETNKEIRVFYTLLGHFSNHEQADTAQNPIFKNAQEFITLPIWQDRVGEYWYYSRWIVAGQPDRPLAEIVAQFKRVNRDTFQVVFMGMPLAYEAEKAGDSWMQEDFLRKFGPRDLVRSEGCRILITEAEIGHLIINTAELCNASSLGGGHIAKTTMDAEYFPDGYNSYASFYAADGSKVFEYLRPNGIIMKRHEKSDSHYNVKR